jgi:tetratricopeptide (TPR) repeat protein
MVGSRLDEARGLKKKATALRNRGQYERAQNTLDEAVRLLSTLLKERELPVREAKDIRAELADTFGMKGGVFRRAGDLSAALAAYQEGRKVEEIDQESTYNLSNVIGLTVTQKGESPNDPILRKDLARAIEHIEREIAGPRRDEWWAWSDLGQFYLLNNEPDKARSCYSDGRKQAGPTAEEIKRHVAILEELSERTAATAPEIAANIRTQITELSR